MLTNNVNSIYKQITHEIPNTVNIYFIYVVTEMLHDNVREMYK